MKNKHEKRIGALKPGNLSNQKDELKQIEGIFPQSLINDFVCIMLKEIVNLEGIIKTYDLNYKLKRRKV